MKTTSVELPEELVRRAEALATVRGKPLTALLVEMLEAEVRQAKLRAEIPWSPEEAAAREKAFLSLAGAFGKTPEDRAETRRIQAVIDKAFGQIEPPAAWE